MSLGDQLAAGLEALELPLSLYQQKQLLNYLDLLMKWNKVYNLTSIRQPEQMLTHHVMDCLAAVAEVIKLAPQDCRLLDVGSGGGLPSVVFAILCPQWQVTAVDAVAKKAAFIETAAYTLNLTNLKSRHARVESLEDAFDLVVARAFASLKDFSAWTDKALRPGGTWVAMKGKYPEEEIAALPSERELVQTQKIRVPGLDAERCLIWLKRGGC